jgi:hypothetical protein
MDERPPLPRPIAWRDVGRCVITTGRLLAARRIHQPRERVGARLHFADGTSAPVYRETVVEQPLGGHPCVLAVEFRLRGVRGGAHRLFRCESQLNTPLFVGFPGFASKLWLAHDQQDRYRGFYEWDGSDRADAYARALWRVLELVSVPGSIHYQVVPGVRRDAVLRDPTLLDRLAPSREPSDRNAWWRLVAVTPPPGR